MDLANENSTFSVPAKGRAVGHSWAHEGEALNSCWGGREGGMHFPQGIRAEAGKPRAGGPPENENTKDSRVVGWRETLS